MSSKPKNRWRTVELPFDAVAEDPEFQYLSQFEELDSYEIIKSKPTKSAKRRSGIVIHSDRPQKLTKLSKAKAKKADNIEKTGADKAVLTRKKRKIINDDAPSMIPSPTTNCVDLEPETSDTTDVDMLPWVELGVTDEILKALRDLNFMNPTAIQKLCIAPAIRDRLDILGAAETGSGKTLAFAIPIVQSLLEFNDDADGPKALILTPTRELAIQIKQHINAILKHTSIKVTAVIGGLSIQKQERLLKKRPEIVVATPGRLWAMIEEKFEYFQNLPKIRFLVIDETDRMVEKGHFLELTSILDYLKTEENLKRQTFVFSATLTFVHPVPKRLLTKVEVRQMTPQQKIEMLVALTGLRDERKIVDITRQFGTCESLVETRINCSNLGEKDTYLYYFLLNYPGRTLIFANSVNCTRRLKNLLTRLNFSPLLIHAQMHQKQRLKSLERFSDCSKSVLLATDVAARGLDIKNIQHVVHYQVPRTAEIYVHRSGRTARASTEGLSMMLVDGQDALNYQKICKSLNREQDLPPFPVKFIQIPLLRDRMKVASQLESLDHRIARMSANERWFSKTAKDADVDLDEDEMLKSLGDNSSGKGRERDALQKQLNFLLKQSLPTDGLTTKYPTSVNDVELFMKSNANSLKENALETMKHQEPVKKFKAVGMKMKLKDRKMKKSKKKRRK